MFSIKMCTGHFLKCGASLRIGRLTGAIDSCVYSPTNAQFMSYKNFLIAHQGMASKFNFD
jgi:hypothetical protein